MNIKETSYFAGLNERQREAVLITEGPLMVLAGAGSGKTKMLTSRMAHLIESLRVPPYQILAVTFTNKAAGEMRERVERALASVGEGSLSIARPEIGTFHSVCVRILRREMAHTPFSKPFVIYDDSDQLRLLKDVMEKVGLGEKKVSPKSLQGAINRLKCDATEPQDLQPAPHDLFERHLKVVYEQYQKDLFQNNALDFGEILCMTYRLIRDNAEVRRKYQQRFRYIHVDEYQDTNRAQYQLLSTLASRRHGGHENMCVVGDEDQSIYRWRGADIRNILEFETDFPGAKIVKLEQNYRSTQTIIQAAGAVIANNTTRKEKTLWTENEEGLAIEHYDVLDERAEADIVVGEVKRLASHEGYSYSDFAIFYRTNAQSRQFEDVLRREKIPYQVLGGLRFYDRKEIKDILAYLKLIMNPADSVSLKRIINVPARGIGKTTLEKLDALTLSEGEGFNYWSALHKAASTPELTSAGTARKLSQFTALMGRLISAQETLSITELYHRILDETGYVQDLRQEGTEEALTRIENLEEFDTLLQEFEEDALKGLSEAEGLQRQRELLPLFLEQSTLVSDVDSLDGNASTLKMMTLHSSKGLEYPVVFMAGMEEGLFPSQREWEEQDPMEIEEERRLCYVGMTRARKLLFMLSAQARRIWGNTVFQEKSRFLAEIPENLIHSRGPRVEQKRPNLTLVKSGSGSNEMVGQRLAHPDYGPGTVVGVEDSGENQKVTVEFGGKQKRKFLLRYVSQYLGLVW
ncbi:UvrD-helicase domain-containing protein [Bdellovibrionota bacterium FG-2]